MIGKLDFIYQYEMLNNNKLFLQVCVLSSMTTTTIIIISYIYSDCDTSHGSQDKSEEFG